MIPESNNLQRPLTGAAGQFEGKSAASPLVVETNSNSLTLDISDLSIIIIERSPE